MKTCERGGREDTRQGTRQGKYRKCSGKINTNVGQISRSNSELCKWFMIDRNRVRKHVAEWNRNRK